MAKLSVSSNGIITDLDVKHYPDGTPLIGVEGLGAEFSVLVRSSLVEDLMAALFFTDAAKERGARNLSLVVPYLPGARQDRLMAAGDGLFTLKSIAKEINARDFDHVVAFDPHSDVASALIDRCKVITAADLIAPPAGKYHAVLAPDGGAEKRAWKVAQKLGVPMLHAWKVRDTATGKLSSFGFEPFDDDQRFPDQMNVLVVDDICDAGGTFIGLADQIRKTYAGSADWLRLDLYVTHGLFTKGTEELLKRYYHVYCTDSVEATRPNVKVVEASRAWLAFASAWRSRVGGK
jgi:ribose-phosphate pyrophosphokinase